MMADRERIQKGEKVSLAQMTEDDQSSFQKWHAGNPELRALIDDNSVPTMEDQLRWFERTKEPDRKMFSLITIDNELIGHAGFVEIDPHSGHLRITIGNSEYWGRGMGTEAVQLLLKQGFEVMGFSYIWLRVLGSNERALKSYAKVGFKRWKEGETEEEKEKGVIRMRISAPV
jgi:RimJ/RimL family protein N-acetyltransferase